VSARSTFSFTARERKRDSTRRVLEDARSQKYLALELLFIRSEERPAECEHPSLATHLRNAHAHTGA